MENRNRNQKVEKRRATKTRRGISPVVEARVYVDDPGTVFVFNGTFWAPAKREDVENAAVPVVTVVAKGRKYVCRNVTLEEALARYEECNHVGVERPGRD